MNQSRTRIYAFGLLTLISTTSVLGQKTSRTIDTRHNLSAQYPGDSGIEKDPAVIFAENFETGTITDLNKRWHDVSNKNEKPLTFSQNIPHQSHGKQSLQITATLGENTGGHLYKQLPREVDQMFARFYVKFSKEPEYIHHFVHLGGQRPARKWPNPQAGRKPDGDDRFSVGIEPVGRYGRHPAPGVWNFYTYWHEMKKSADGRHWGNSLHPVTPQQVPSNQWQCVEVMLKLNSAPDKADGELALWLDGKQAMHFSKGVQRGKWSGMGFDLVKQDGVPFEGFNFRSSTDLKINYFWLLHYVTNAPLRRNRVTNPKRTNRVWFDDIVIATKYIGPIQK